MTMNDFTTPNSEQKTHEINTIPIFCINLKRANERREAMVQEWTIKRGIDLIFFTAFDRRNLDRNNLPNSLLLNNSKLSDGEICCSISHLSLLNSIISSGIQQAIILEDDAMPLFQNKNEFFERINQYKLDQNQADMILMHNRLHHNLHVQPPILSIDQLIIQEHHHILKYRCTCTQSIFYKNTEAMKQYSAGLSRLDCPADWATNHFLQNSKTKLGIFTKPLTAHETNCTYIDGKRGPIVYLE
jgi:GR25 family glycosyltransferase involved in LPS biosynthesis